MRVKVYRGSPAASIPPLRYTGAPISRAMVNSWTADYRGRLPSSLRVKMPGYHPRNHAETVSRYLVWDSKDSLAPIKPIYRLATASYSIVDRPATFFSQLIRAGRFDSNAPRVSVFRRSWIYNELEIGDLAEK